MNVLYISCVFLFPLIYGYDEKCAWGESHWCSSLNNAIDCGAKQHCIDTVWKYNVAYKNDKGDVCTFCTEVILDVKKLILANDTKEAIEEYVRLACHQIPVPSLEKLCDVTADQNLDELLGFVKANLDPQLICGMLGLCSGFQDDTLRFIPEKKLEVAHSFTNVAVKSPVGGKICDECKELVQDLVDELKNADNLEELEELIKLNICVQLPLQALREACNSIIAEYIPEMAELIADSLDPLIMCQTLELCSGGEHILAKMRLKKSSLFHAINLNGGQGECYICTTAMNELQKLETDETMRDEILQFFEKNICDHIGGYKTECIETIKIYGIQVLDIIASELDPEGICEALGFCQSGNNKQVSTNAQAILRDVMPAIEISKAVKHAEIGVVKHSKMDLECSLCEEVFGVLEAELLNNKTLPKIIAMLEKVCVVLPDTMKAQCKSFLEQYAAALVDILVQQLTPEIGCTELGFCDGKRSPWALHLTKTSYLALPKPNVDFCPICESVISTVDKYLEDNDTKSEIRAFFKMACDSLPIYREECDEMIVANIDKVIDFLAEGLTPEEICEQLGLCADVEKKPAVSGLLGASKCTWGPAYWCKSVEAALECNAIEHCRSKVWGLESN